MFYCNDILKKNNGKFGIVWIAAFHGSKAKFRLGRRDIFRVNIRKSCIDLIHPRVPFSLRLQSTLMLGIIRVYKEQVRFFCEDLKTAWRQLQMALTLEHLRIIDLGRDQMSMGACTLADPSREYLNRNFETDFPKDIFTRSPADLFSGDESFFTIIGPVSPLIEVPSPTFSSPHSITMPEASGQKNEKIQVPGENDIEEPPSYQGEQEEPPVDERPFPQEPGEPLEGEIPGQQNVLILDEETMEMIPVPPDVERKRQSAEHTPHDARIEVSTPTPPRKRRRRGPRIDMEKKLSNERMKENVIDVSRTTQDTIIEPQRRVSVSELFKNPAHQGLRVEPVLHFWRENSTTRRLSYEEMQFSPSHPIEALRGDSEDEEGLSSPELLRREQTPASSTFEISREEGSIGINQTPFRSNILDPGSTSGITPDPTRSPPGLAPIDESPMHEPPEMLPVIEEAPDVSPPSFELPDDFERKLFGAIAESMGSEDNTTFQTVITQSENRKTAARAFYELLVLHSKNVVVLSQDGFLQDIGITRGANV